jgi:hypothetical protein
MKLKPLVRGVASYLPGVNFYFSKETGGTDSARYCYSVWLRHLVMAFTNRLNCDVRRVAELGPGDSLGVGIAALLSGCERYFAFDVVPHAYAERNLKIFDELVTLFRRRAAIPANDEFPEVKPVLGTYEFPKQILTDERLNDALSEYRLDEIRKSIVDTDCEDSLIRYRVPWYDLNVIEHESVDMIYSQAVLEHVDDLTNTYRTMRAWLKADGYVSNQVDFRCHGTADEWNGHWMYSDLTWTLMRGRRPYLLNREPHSSHIRFLEEQNFSIVCDQTVKSVSRLPKDTLATRFRSMSDDDLTTSGAFIQAVKRPQ